MRAALRHAGERPGSVRVRKLWVCPAPPPSSLAAGKNGTQRLRAPAMACLPPPPGPHHASSLPEFATAPASRAHRPPARAAVRADRPPPLELRPRPPRESQARAALRALACCSDHAPCGSDHGRRRRPPRPAAPCGMSPPRDVRAPVRRRRRASE
ncbi:type II inositol polyphosphate 5-phosphatase 14-like [Panicum virgatum]|uniref:type II inositol polyphosphate 5-phosphatase 14-like n=1 Tax=Panicum virgatum TaxID=38727 RepID=UPI0019D6554F|nr:type II inositol polyphosphate 5-phosphatase 14-like [Panicum virgatum]